MGERYGSWGKILRVDLSKGTTAVEEMDEATFRRHPGGRALIAHYLLTELPKGADPLGPENILIFAMGVLAGTPLSGASRHAVGAKSPPVMTKPLGSTATRLASQPPFGSAPMNRNRCRNG